MSASDNLQPQQFMHRRAAQLQAEGRSLVRQVPSAEDVARRAAGPSGRPTLLQGGKTDTSAPTAITPSNVKKLKSMRRLHLASLPPDGIA